MGTLLRLDSPRAGESPRWTVGVSVSSKCSEVAAALVAAGGYGLDLRARVAGVTVAELPSDVTALFGTLAAAQSPAIDDAATLRRHLAEIEGSVVTKLLASRGVAPNKVLAVGVNDPGLWKFGRGKSLGHFSLCDSAVLAEATGLTVIDAFPARDLAQGGLGGPVTAVAEWILLRHPGRDRVLLDLGRTVRLSYLPAALADNAVSRIMSFQTGPGTELLDLLAQRFSGGRHRYDPGGRLAVQGRRIDPLIEHWLSDPYFHRPPPRWHPQGVRPERFLAEGMKMAVDAGWSMRDLLCSATHFVAETIGLALRTPWPERTEANELLVTGGGQRNGLLLREIGRVAAAPSAQIGRPDVSEEALAPAAVGVLVLLYLDQVPASQSAITGTEAPRILGRLTPGSPRNWQRLLQHAAGCSPAHRPLRSAV